MKKIKLFSLILIIALFFCACGATSSAIEEKTKEETVNVFPEQKSDTVAEIEELDEELETVEENQPKEELIDGMRPEIKEAIDSYEEFINVYCEFLEEYDSSDAMMLIKYTQMLSSYTEFAEEFEAIEQEDLNDEEMKYYTQVSLRCSSRVLEASGNLTSDMSGLMSGLSDLAGVTP